MASQFLVPAIDAGGGLPLLNLVLNAPVSSNAYIGGGRVFNGTTQYFSRASHASHNLGTGDVLISTMFLRNGTGNKPICAKYQDGSNYWQLEFTAGNVLHFIAVIGASTLIEITGTTAITSTTSWYHVAVAIDRSAAGGCKIYLNNVDDTAAGAVTSISTIDNTGAFWVGTGTNGTIYFPGTLTTFGIAKPTDVTTIVTAAVLSLYNFRNGKQYNDITAAERTAWNLTSYYDLNEISGNAVERIGAINLTDNASVTAGNGPAEAIAQDETANAHHGALLGFSAAQQITAWTTDVPAVDDCADGYSLTLDGATNRVAFATTDYGTSHTLSGWVKTSDADFKLFSNNYSPAEYGLYYTGAVLAYYNGSAAASVAYTELDDGAWHHVTIARSTTSVAFYVDGTQVGTTQTLANNDALSLQCLGADFDGNFPLAGLIDDVRIYSVSLTALQVAALAAGDPTAANYPSSANLAAHWKFDDGAQANPLTGDPILGHRSIVGDWYFIQGTISKRPLYDSVGINSRPSLEFNGSSKLLYSTQTNKATQQGCLSLAIKTGATVASSCLFALTDTTGATDRVTIGIDASSKLYVSHVSGGTTNAVTGGTALSANTRYIVQVWSDGTTWGLKLNAANETLTVTGSNTGAWFADVASPDNWSLGALKANTETLFFDGDIAQYVGYDDETTAGKRQDMYHFLLSRYGIGA